MDTPDYQQRKLSPYSEWLMNIKIRYAEEEDLRLENVRRQ